VMSAPSTEMPIVIFFPSFSMSAMYLAVSGKGAGVAGAAEDDACDDVASVDVPLEQAVRAPNAIIALTPMSMVRKCFLM
jgi:hypothetical protein